MWFNKKATVNCTKNHKAGYNFTLVDNETCEMVSFSDSARVFNYIVNNFGPAKRELEKITGDKEDKWKKYLFFVDRKIAPTILNQFGGSPHIKSWQVERAEIFDKEGLVLVRYVADKQILFQTPDGPDIRL